MSLPGPHWTNTTMPMADKNSCPYPQPVEDIRAQEYPALAGSAYLDHAGSQLVPKSLITAFAKDLGSHLYGNPHSESDPAAIAGHKIDSIRERTLHFFGADPKEYDLVFVANATAGLKLVGEVVRDYVHSLNSGGPASSRLGFRKKLFGSKQAARFRYCYHKDSHNSVLGVRAFTSDVKVFAGDGDVERWMVETRAATACADAEEGTVVTLFAYPGQSNLTGRRLPLSWAKRARQCDANGRTYTMLDAAALATTKQLHISDWKPDFAVLSMYKIFGFPDLGVLLVRKAAAGPLFGTRRYFGGGTVEMVLPFDPPWVSKKDGSIHDAAEDGTLPFHNIIALGHALDSIDRVYGGMQNISVHTQILAREMHDRLLSLKHRNGNPVVKILKDSNTQFGNPNNCGATVSFLVYSPDGMFVPSRNVEKVANTRRVFLRAGSMCNPGGISTYLSWTSADLKAAFDRGHKCSDPHEEKLGRPVGVVRASLGACSSREEIDMLIQFLEVQYVDNQEKLLVSIDEVSLSRSSTAVGKTDGGHDEHRCNHCGAVNLASMTPSDDHRHAEDRPHKAPRVNDIKHSNVQGHRDSLIEVIKDNPHAPLGLHGDLGHDNYEQSRYVRTNDPNITFSNSGSRRPIPSFQSLPYIPPQSSNNEAGIMNNASYINGNIGHGPSKAPGYPLSTTASPPDRRSAVFGGANLPRMGSSELLKSSSSRPATPSRSVRFGGLAGIGSMERLGEAESYLQSSALGGATTVARPGSSGGGAMSSLFGVLSRSNSRKEKKSATPVSAAPLLASILRRPGGGSTTALPTVQDYSPTNMHSANLHSAVPVHTRAPTPGSAAQALTSTQTRTFDYPHVHSHGLHHVREHGPFQSGYPRSDSPIQTAGYPLPPERTSSATPQAHAVVERLQKQHSASQLREGAVLRVTTRRSSPHLHPSARRMI